MSPILSATVVLYWRMPNPGVALWLLAGVVSLFSLFQIVQATYVHTKRIHIDDYGIEVRTSTRTIMRVNYRDVLNATLRERVNPISRTDRLLIFESMREILTYNLSTLAPAEEETVLNEIKTRTKLVIKQDRAAI